MNITVISVGKIKEKYFTAAIDEYSKRLSRFAKLNIIEVADEKIPDNASEKEMEQIKEKEGNKILAKLPQNSFVVTLCIEGKEYSSEELAKKNRRYFNDFKSYYIHNRRLTRSFRYRKIKVGIKIEFR